MTCYMVGVKKMNHHFAKVNRNFFSSDFVPK